MFVKKTINSFADQIFDKNDLNRSGFLDVNEIYPAIIKVFELSNLPPPTYQ